MTASATAARAVGAFPVPAAEPARRCHRPMSSAKRRPPSRLAPSMMRSHVGRGIHLPLCRQSGFAYALDDDEAPLCQLVVEKVEHVERVFVGDRGDPQQGNLLDRCLGQRLAIRAMQEPDCSSSRLNRANPSRTTFKSPTASAGHPSMRSLRPRVPTPPVAVILARRDHRPRRLESVCDPDGAGAHLVCLEVTPHHDGAAPTQRSAFDEVTLDRLGADDVKTTPNMVQARAAHTRVGEEDGLLAVAFVIPGLSGSCKLFCARFSCSAPDPEDASDRVHDRARRS